MIEVLDALSKILHEKFVSEGISIDNKELLPKRISDFCYKNNLNYKELTYITISIMHLYIEDGALNDQII